MRSSPISTSSNKHHDVPGRHALLTSAWDREWQQLLHRRTSRKRPIVWAAAHPRLLPYPDLEAVLHASGRGRSDYAADGVLSAVVERAARVDVAAHLVRRRILLGRWAAAVRRGATGQ